MDIEAQGTRSGNVPFLGRGSSASSDSNKIISLMVAAANNKPLELGFSLNGRVSSLLELPKAAFFVSLLHHLGIGTQVIEGRGRTTNFARVRELQHVPSST